MDLNQELQPRKPIKASAILYIVSVVSGFFGIEIIILDVINRSPHATIDTFLELLELNPISQFGAIGIVLALFFFWLGLMTDRRDG